MATRPDKKNFADSNIAIKTQPSDGFLSNGFTITQPPVNFFNWILNNIYRWIQYFDENVGKNVSFGHVHSNNTPGIELPFSFSGPNIQSQVEVLKRTTDTLPIGGTPNSGSGSVTSTPGSLALTVGTIGTHSVTAQRFTRASTSNDFTYSSGLHLSKGFSIGNRVWFIDQSTDRNDHWWLRGYTYSNGTLTRASSNDVDIGESEGYFSTGFAIGDDVWIMEGQYKDERIRDNDNRFKGYRHSNGTLTRASSKDRDTSGGAAFDIYGVFVIGNNIWLVMDDENRRVDLHHYIYSSGTLRRGSNDLNIGNSIEGGAFAHGNNAWVIDGSTAMGFEFAGETIRRKSVNDVTLSSSREDRGAVVVNNDLWIYGGTGRTFEAYEFATSLRTLLTDMDTADSGILQSRARSTNFPDITTPVYERENTNLDIFRVEGDTRVSTGTIKAIAIASTTAILKGLEVDFFPQSPLPIGTLRSLNNAYLNTFLSSTTQLYLIMAVEESDVARGNCVIWNLTNQLTTNFPRFFADVTPVYTGPDFNVTNFSLVKHFRTVRAYNLTEALASLSAAVTLTPVPSPLFGLMSYTYNSNTNKLKIVLSGSSITQTSFHTLQIRDDQQNELVDLEASDATFVLADKSFEWDLSTNPTPTAGTYTFVFYPSGNLNVYEWDVIPPASNWSILPSGTKHYLIVSMSSTDITNGNTLLIRKK